jgi:hypothetical protein
LLWEKWTELAGQLARLPHGEKVKIESVEGSRALVRRIGGERQDETEGIEFASFAKLRGESLQNMRPAKSAQFVVSEEAIRVEAIVD